MTELLLEVPTRLTEIEEAIDQANATINQSNATIGELLLEAKTSDDLFGLRPVQDFYDWAESKFGYSRAWTEKLVSRAIDPADRRTASRPKDISSEPEDADESPAKSTVPQQYNSGNNEWYTPTEITEAARKVLGEIDLDPASSATANTVVKAKLFYSIDDDGLSHDWVGKVFMNPPYSGSLINLFVTKFLDHWQSSEISAGIVLVNNATETQWGQQLGSYACAVCFPEHRIKFWSPDKETAVPLQGQAIYYFGADRDRFRAVFGELGFIKGDW